MGNWERPGRSDQWYTPKHVFDAMGNPRFDLDVAAPKLFPSWINAAKWYWEGSLEKEWSGFIWMNPPFGGRNSLKPWLKKFFLHGNGIALTPDRTSAPWFRDAWQFTDLTMFTPKLKFVRPDGSTGKQPSNGTCLWAVGEQGCAALRRAEENGLGILAQPVKSHEL